ncbi:hypothetical protein GRI72_02740 [Altererythrobacter marinus]|uniref:Terminase n=1 Tax=Pelagerythrobacter marinus TaxID=538382 RepID=A0ABW9USA1_9SPHN|nr:hypothetical protein [Pelagerythrobacter marinus]MXO67749.1 hypothetical protein [Pelagerythrobacter marinus]
MRNDQPISEQYRLAALDWCQVDSAARMLEEGKTTYLAQQIAQLGEMAHAKAERIVKSSPEWADYIKKMVNARSAANRAKVDLDYLKMRHMERTSEEANARSERKL